MKNISTRVRTASRRREQKALARAVAIKGSITKLGQSLGVSYQAVQGWFREGVPMERCCEIEMQCLGMVQCEDLREDYVLLEVRPYRRWERDAIYVSGPMTGLPDLNFPAFHAEATRLRNAGYRVVNPAEVQMPANATWSDYLRADLIEMLKHCASVVVLPGWTDSRGAQLEVHVARSLDMPVREAGAAA